jgi:hypothetical protein
LVYSSRKPEILHKPCGDLDDLERGLGVNYSVLYEYRQLFVSKYKLHLTAEEEFKRDMEKTVGSRQGTVRSELWTADALEELE